MEEQENSRCLDVNTLPSLHRSNVRAQPQQVLCVDRSQVCPILWDALGEINYHVHVHEATPLAHQAKKETMPYIRQMHLQPNLTASRFRTAAGKAAETMLRAILQLELKVSTVAPD